MRFEVDTVAKTITLLDSCTIEELVALMNKFADEPTKYLVSVKPEPITLPNPIIPNWPIQPFNPWQQPPIITYTSGQNISSIN